MSDGGSAVPLDQLVTEYFTIGLAKCLLHRIAVVEQHVADSSRHFVHSIRKIAVFLFGINDVTLFDTPLEQ